MTDIGFIGLGNMGGPMLVNLVKAGHKIKAFDLSADAMDRASEAGAQITNDAASACRGVDVVITMLPAGKHVRAVYTEAVLDNAEAMASRLVERGIDLVSGGTDNHLMLLDLRSGEISGKDAEEALGRAGITVNKNTVPGETRPPMVTSGVRIGTPAMTTRGGSVEDSQRAADWIADVIHAPEDVAAIERIGAEVANWCEAHPVYPSGVGPA